MNLDTQAPPVLQGYALWLCPAEPAAAQLAAAINALAEREGTPAFRPHLTLLGAMTGPEATRTAQVERLARRLQPVPLPVTAVTAKPDYFRSVVLEVALTPELMRLHELWGQRAAGLSGRRRLPSPPERRLWLIAAASEDRADRRTDASRRASTGRQESRTGGAGRPAQRMEDSVSGAIG
ncbi:MAG: hypothetical protein EXR52_07835 [Dehalococcoidia bacterium]|nr:hypothetical protein [Dehalococcoidia bacterium]